MKNKTNSDINFQNKNLWRLLPDTKESSVDYELNSTDDFFVLIFFIVINSLTIDLDIQGSIESIFVEQNMLIENRKHFQYEIAAHREIKR